MANMRMWRILLVLVSILTRPYQTSAVTTYNYRVVDGDCTGNDIKALIVSEAACAAKCTSAPDCVGWVYIYPDQKEKPDMPCYLKRIMCLNPADKTRFVYKSYYKEIVTDVAGYRSASGDCSGNDILPFENAATPQACGALCTAMPECAGFLYVRSGTTIWSHPPCLLKSRMCKKELQMTTFQIVAYFKLHEGMTVFQESSEIPLTSDPRDQAMLIRSRMECARKCHRDADCTYFSVSENGGKHSCDMSSSMQPPAPAPTTPYYKKQSVIKS